MIKTASVLILFVFFTGICLYAAERERCAVCGMYLDLYKRTRFVIYFDDNTSKSTCSLACAAKLIDKNRNKVKDIKAADFVTGELMDARKAFYVEGSNVPGVMSYVGRFAFSSRNKALFFKKKHGGRIVSFDEAVKNQLRDEH